MMISKVVTTGDDKVTLEYENSIQYIKVTCPPMLQYLINFNISKGNFNKIKYILGLLEIPEENLTLKERIAVFQLLQKDQQ